MLIISYFNHNFVSKVMNPSTSNPHYKIISSITPYSPKSIKGLHDLLDLSIRLHNFFLCFLFNRFKTEAILCRMEYFKL